MSLSIQIPTILVVICTGFTQRHKLEYSIYFPVLPNELLSFYSCENDSENPYSSAPISILIFREEGACTWRQSNGLLPQSHVNLNMV